MDLDQLLTELTTFADTNALVEAIKKKAKTIYQPIFNDGHAAATATHTEKQTKLQEQLDTAKADLKVAKDDLKKLQETQPDVAELHKEYGKKIQGLEANIEDLKTQQVAERRSVRKEKVIAKVRDELSKVVLPEYAQALTDTDTFKARVDFDDKDLPRLMQADLKLPFAGGEDDQVKAVVEELAKNVPAKLRRSDVDAGTGRPGSTGGGASGKEYYQRIRDEAAARKAAGSAAIPDPMSELQKRTGMATV